MAEAGNNDPGAARPGTAPPQGGQPGGAAGAAAAPSTSVQPPAGAPPGGHWSAVLPEDIRGHAYVQQFREIGDFAKNAIDAQGMIGRKGVILPKDDAKPEEWNGFYEQLGRPKDAGEYKFGVPEGYQETDADKALQSHMRPIVHQAGLTQKQLDLVAKGINEYSLGIAKRLADDVGKAKEALRQEWGDSHDQRMELANRAFKQFAGEDAETLRQVQTAGGSFLLDDPRVARLFAKIGAELAEDTGTPGGARSGRGDPFGSPAAAKAEVERVEREAYENPKHPLNDQRHPDHNGTHQRMMQLRMVYAQAEAAKAGA